MYGILRFGVIFTPEIAQCPLGDLTFKVHTPHYIYSSALVKVLWDICNRISTPALICPVSASMSLLFPCASKRSIQNRLSVSWRNPSSIENSGS